VQNAPNNLVLSLQLHRDFLYFGFSVLQPALTGVFVCGSGGGSALGTALRFGGV
jgi:hypothetical protein